MKFDIGDNLFVVILCVAFIASCVPKTTVNKQEINSVSTSQVTTK